MEKVKLNNKYYTVAQASKLIGLSTVTMYKKIRQLDKELIGEIEKKNRTTYLTDRAIEIIKENSFIDTDIEIEEQEENNNIAIDILLQQVKHLQEQIKEKDLQIQRKDVQIKESNELIKNTQILFKNEQEKTNLLLDNKRAEQEIAVTEENEEPNEETTKKRFRLFKKKAK